MILGPDGKPVTSRPTLDEVFAKDCTRRAAEEFFKAPAGGLAAVLRGKLVKPDGTWATPLVVHGSPVEWPL